MNLREQDRFYQMFTRSRAASSQVPKENSIVTEIVDGLIVSRPANKIEYLSTREAEAEAEPIVIDLQQKSKAGSVPVNKLREIIRFQKSNGRH